MSSPDRLRQRLSDRQRRQLAVVTGSGQVTTAAIAGGADLLLALSAGAFRSIGVGSLASFMAYGNANDDTMALLRSHVVPRSGMVPVVAGVLASDPGLRLDERLEELRELGVAGITNWPAVGFVDGRFGRALADDGFTIESEIRLLAAARKHGLVACGFALSAEAATAFARAGCEALVLNVGLTHAHDDLRARRDHLERSLLELKAMVAAVNGTGKSPACLAFGGPITEAADLDDLYACDGVHGFAGGSVFERIPVQRTVEATVRRFAHAGRRKPDDDPLIGASAPMRELARLVARIAPHDVHVCIEGESGTGKELVATRLHRLSGRANGPLITLNCGAIPAGLLESEFFGHEKGAFTGADRRRAGKFELADGGTLFLDEIADLSPAGQVALLRAIQSREIVRVGGDAPIAIDVRIVCASNRPLDRLVEQGAFRADLYHRLDGITLRIPPLRERLDDLPPLTAHILSALSARLDRRLVGVSAGFAARLAKHAWPGNVRELEQVLGRAALLEDGEKLEGIGFHPGKRTASAFQEPDRQARATRAIAEAGGNKSRAAGILGVSRKTLYEWLREDPA